MNTLGKRLLKKIGRDIITFFTKRIRNRILFLQESASGSNSYALWKLASDDVKKKYDLILYHERQIKEFADFVAKHRLVSSAQLIVTTHGSYKPSKKHIHLQLWHAASAKKLGVMEGERRSRFKPPKSWQQVDYIMSYSETYSTFLNACMVTDPNKYIITGAPRNDFLFLSDGLSNMRKIFGESVADNRLIFFVPTFREGYYKSQGNKTYDNPFGFKEFSPEGFDTFLEENKCKLIFKPHPHEEAVMLSYFHNYPLRNMLLLRDKDLVTNRLDFYELLNACDMLITDYSSVFDDYLLLDRPIVFAPVDIDTYGETRGFVVESFESWAPGPKVFDQNKLQGEIARCLTENNYYGERRVLMRNLQHRYKDGDSSTRLWNFIDSILGPMNP